MTTSIYKFFHWVPIGIISFYRMKAKHHIVCFIINLFILGELCTYKLLFKEIIWMIVYYELSIKKFAIQYTHFIAADQM